MEKEERLELEGCHGIIAKKQNKKWNAPKCVVKSDIPNRTDVNNFTSCSEYLDDDDVLDEKIDLFIEILKKSKYVVAYTGAGISRAAGIGDYASKADNSLMNEVKKLDSPYDAQPTLAHKVLVMLEKIGLLHYWVQQNHDGLPQKAG
jgi:NAD-dependent SIR2 family protein deacetylase